MGDVGNQAWGLRLQRPGFRGIGMANAHYDTPFVGRLSSRAEQTTMLRDDRLLTW